VAVLVDEARWPAHGRLWAHLVSDTSLSELHAFAARAGLAPRSFDADHYDVPDAALPDLVALGAEPVTSRELLVRLVASGLRVRQRDKPARPEPGAGLQGVAGVLLAAGAGTRFGGPKALARDASGTPWLVSRVAALRGGGCDPVLVVLGAEAGAARALLPDGAEPVVADDWAQGMSASLRAGLRAAAALERPPVAALVALLDVPGLTPAAVARLVQRAAGPRALARAAYAGRAGHPVLLGRSHWSAAAAAATGDRGAGPYLKRAGAELVECSDVADGDDVDSPDAGTPGAPTLVR